MKIFLKICYLIFLIQNNAIFSKITHLILAAQLEEIDRVQNLLKRSTDKIDFADDEGWTALTHAVFKNNIEITKILLEKKASTEIKENFFGWPPLHFAAKKGFLQIVDLLLTNGANVNQKDKDGFTALMLASREGHIQVIERLLEDKNCDILATNKYGQSAEFYAANKDIKAMIQRAIIIRQNYSIPFNAQFEKPTNIFLQILHRSPYPF